MNDARDRRLELGLLLARGIVGGLFVYHGAQKLFGAWGGPGLTGFAGFLGSLGLPAPYFQAILAGSAEFFGGLALLTGLATRLAVVPLLGTMMVAVWAVSGHGFDTRDGGFEFPLVLAVLLAGLGLTGPGAFSLDALRRSVRRNEAKARSGEGSEVLIEGGVR